MLIVGDGMRVLGWMAGIFERARWARGELGGRVGVWVREREQ